MFSTAFCISLWYSANLFAVLHPEEKERDDVILPPFGWLGNRTKGEVNENMMELSAIIFFIPHIWYRYIRERYLWQIMLCIYSV